MSDTSGFNEETKTVESGAEPLWQRLIYMLVFWLLGYVAFCLSIFLAAVQLILLAVNKQKNEELRGFSASLVRYVWECLAYITFTREEKPFPFGKFPSAG